MKLSVAEGEVADDVRMLQGAAKLHLTDTVVEETRDHRLVTRHIPIGSLPCREHAQRLRLRLPRRLRGHCAPEL